MLTLGSLFDGIGGFPLAASRLGIKPLWASEIEPFPIAVTKYHFPDMVHVGDITKLNGADLPPVDIITGGSPCQGLSVAGARLGLEDVRSGLFTEQIRIIKEMRDADRKRGRTDDAVRPGVAIWENVPGSFSCSNGRDFWQVLQSFVGIEEPDLYVVGPETGRWEYVGTILGNQSCLAWTQWDAQYFSLAQRRKRCFLVVDFRGYSPIQILFNQTSLLGNPAAGKGTGEGAPTATGAGAEGPGGIVTA